MGSISEIHSVSSRLSQVSVSIVNFTVEKGKFHPQSPLQNQVGDNSCAVRYRTLSGGIGRSPSPTHSSDYVDDEEDDIDDDITTNTAILNGITNATIDSPNVSSTNNLKSKRSNHSSSLAKASTISYQKASVHNVWKIVSFVFRLMNEN